MKAELISGRVLRAQDGEVMVQLRHELAITRKRLVRLESQRGPEDPPEPGAEGVPEWTEMNGNHSGHESHVRGQGLDLGHVIGHEWVGATVIT